MEQNYNKEAVEFYAKALDILNGTQRPFLIAGAFAIHKHTQIFRDTKDMDIFCKPEDYQFFLKEFSNLGYKIEITDIRWLAKIFKDEFFVDVIFSGVNKQFIIDDSWFQNAQKGELFGKPVTYIAPEELLFCKIYVQARERYDGADINHLILKKGKEMDWKKILSKIDDHWKLLFAQILSFLFVYPAERDIIPEWLIEEMQRRLTQHMDMPVSLTPVCRGPLIDQRQYTIDIMEWGFRTTTMFTV